MLVGHFFSRAQYPVSSAQCPVPSAQCLDPEWMAALALGFMHVRGSPCRWRNDPFQ